MQHSYHFLTLIERDEDGMYVATVPALRGCHTQAKSIEELLPRVREAIECIIRVMSTGDSDRCRPPVLGHADHLFRRHDVHFFGRPESVDGMLRNLWERT